MTTDKLAEQGKKGDEKRKLINLFRVYGIDYNEDYYNALINNLIEIIKNEKKPLLDEMERLEAENKELREVFDKLHLWFIKNENADFFKYHGVEIEYPHAFVGLVIDKINSLRKSSAVKTGERRSGLDVESLDSQEGDNKEINQ